MFLPYSLLYYTANAELMLFIYLLCADFFKKTAFFLPFCLLQFCKKYVKILVEYCKQKAG